MAVYRNFNIERPRPLCLDDQVKFGKHKGKFVQDILHTDWQYIDWLLREKIKRFAPEVITALVEIKNRPENLDKHYHAEYMADHMQYRRVFYGRY